MNFVVSIYIARILLIFIERERKIKLDGSSPSKEKAGLELEFFFVWRGKIVVLIY